MLLEGEDSVPTKCYWGECERALHRWVCCEFSLYLYIIYIFTSGVRRAINHIRSLFCGFLRHSLIKKKHSQTVVVLNALKTRTRSDLPPWRRQQGRRHTIHGPTYSMARVIGDTVWQEGSICQCQSLVTWTDLSNGHSYSTCIACHKRQGECFICPCHFRAHVLQNTWCMC